MKPLGPLRPEPPRRPRGEFWSVAFSLASIIIGVGAGLYCFRDAGVIGDTALCALLVFLVAVAAGILIAMDIEGSANDPMRRDAGEVPPPRDIFLVWPPSETQPQEPTGSPSTPPRKDGRP